MYTKISEISRVFMHEQHQQPPLPNNVEAFNGARRCRKENGCYATPCHYKNNRESCETFRMSMSATSAFSCVLHKLYTTLVPMIPELCAPHKCIHPTLPYPHNTHKAPQPRTISGQRVWRVSSTWADWWLGCSGIRGRKCYTTASLSDCRSAFISQRAADECKSLV